MYTCEFVVDRLILIFDVLAIRLNGLWEKQVDIVISKNQALQI